VHSGADPHTDWPARPRNTSHQKPQATSLGLTRRATANCCTCFATMVFISSSRWWRSRVRPAMPGTEGWASQTWAP